MEKMAGSGAFLYFNSEFMALLVTIIDLPLYTLIVIAPVCDIIDDMHYLSQIYIQVRIIDF